MSSYLSGANVIPSAFPHDIASCRDMLNVLLLVVRDGDIARMAPSSAYPNLFLGLPIWNNGAMYSMNKMPENGDPCGSPHDISVLGPSSLSKRICTVLPVTNEAVQSTRLFGHP